MFTGDDLFLMIKKMCASDIKELGSTDTAQNTYLIAYTNRALSELAHIAYRTRESAALNITTDGPQTFLYGGSAITDMYAPLRILGPSGSDTVKRTSYAAPTGWWRESDSVTTFHTKGMTGNHTLHYVRYPTKLTSSSDIVDFPESGVMGLAFWVCGIVKESANGYEESAAMYGRARERLKITVQANIDARGVSSGGFVPSINTVDQVFKG